MSEPARRMPAEGPTALATWRLLVTLGRAALGGEEGCQVRGEWPEGQCESIILRGFAVKRIKMI